MSVFEILKKYDFILEKRQIINIWYNYKYFGVKIDNISNKEFNISNKEFNISNKEFNISTFKIYNKEFNINDFERVIIIYKTMLDLIIFLNKKYKGLNVNNTFKHKCIGEDLDNDQWYYYYYYNNNNNNNNNNKYIIDYDINGINIYKRIFKNQYKLFEKINYEIINVNEININEIFNKINLN